jgi:uncharacterized protein YjlB
MTTKSQTYYNLGVWKIDNQIYWAHYHSHTHISISANQSYNLTLQGGRGMGIEMNPCVSSI